MCRPYRPVGGHQGAVGVTVETSKIDAFRKRLSKVMAELPEEEFEASGEDNSTSKP